LKYKRVKTEIRNRVGYDITDKAITLPFHMRVSDSFPRGGISGMHDDYCGNIVGGNLSSAMQGVNTHIREDMGLRATWLWTY
jgi:hypothetical protein